MLHSYIAANDIVCLSCQYRSDEQVRQQIGDLMGFESELLAVAESSHDLRTFIRKHYKCQ